MSGSSLDGLDLALIQFTAQPDRAEPSWTILASDTLSYQPVLREDLRKAPSSSGLDLLLA